MSETTGFNPAAEQAAKDGQLQEQIESLKKQYIDAETDQEKKLIQEMIDQNEAKLSGSKKESTASNAEKKDKVNATESSAYAAQKQAIDALKDKYVAAEPDEKKAIQDQIDAEEAKLADLKAAENSTDSTSTQTTYESQKQKVDDLKDLYTKATFPADKAKYQEQIDLEEEKLSKMDKPAEEIKTVIPSELQSKIDANNGQIRYLNDQISYLYRNANLDEARKLMVELEDAKEEKARLEEEAKTVERPDFTAKIIDFERNIALDEKELAEYDTNIEMAVAAGSLEQADAMKKDRDEIAARIEEAKKSVEDMKSRTAKPEGDYIIEGLKEPESAKLKIEGKLNGYLEIDMVKLKNPEISQKFSERAFRWLQKNPKARIATGLGIGAVASIFGGNIAVHLAKAVWGGVSGYVGGSGMKAMGRELSVNKHWESSFKGCFSENGELDIDAVGQKMQSGELKREDLINLYKEYTEIASAQGRQISESLQAKEAEANAKIRGIYADNEKVRMAIDKYKRLKWGWKALVGVGVAAAGVGLSFGGAAAAGALGASHAVASIFGMSLGAGLQFSQNSLLSEGKITAFQHSDKVMRLKEMIDAQGGINEDEMKAIVDYRESTKKSRTKWGIAGAAVMGIFAGAMGAWSEHRAHEAVPSHENNGSTAPHEDHGTGAVVKAPRYTPDGKEISDDYGKVKVEITEVKPGAESASSEFTNNNGSGADFLKNYDKQIQDFTHGPSVEGHGADQQASGADFLKNYDKEIRDFTHGPSVENHGSNQAAAPLFEQSPGQVPEVPHSEIIPAIHGDKVTVDFGQNYQGSDNLHQEFGTGAFNDGLGASERMAVKIAEGLEGKGQVHFANDAMRDQFINGLDQKMRAENLFDLDGSVKNLADLKELNPAHLAAEVARDMEGGARFHVYLEHDHIDSISHAIKEPAAGTGIQHGYESETKPTETPTAEAVASSTPAAEQSNGLETLANADQASFDGAAALSKESADMILDPKNGYLDESVASALKREIENNRISYDDIKISVSPDHHLTDIKINLHGTPDHLGRTYIGHQLLKPFEGTSDNSADILSQTPVAEEANKSFWDRMPWHRDKAPDFTVIDEQSKAAGPTIENQPHTPPSGVPENAAEPQQSNYPEAPVPPSGQPETAPVPPVVNATESFVAPDVVRQIQERIGNLKFEDIPADALNNIKTAHPDWGDAQVFLSYKNGMQMELMNQAANGQK